MTIHAVPTKLPPDVRPKYQRIEFDLRPRPSINWREANLYSRKNRVYLLSAGADRGAWMQLSENKYSTPASSAPMSLNQIACNGIVTVTGGIAAWR